MSVCKFSSEISGTIGSDYSFDSSNPGFEEIQAGSKLIFFDMVDNEIKFWGNGKVASVKFSQAGSHSAKIGDFEAVGMEESEEITALSAPRVEVSVELKQELVL